MQALTDAAVGVARGLRGGSPLARRAVLRALPHVALCALATMLGRAHGGPAPPGADLAAANANRRARVDEVRRRLALRRRPALARYAARTSANGPSISTCPLLSHSARSQRRSSIAWSWPGGDHDAAAGDDLVRGGLDLRAELVVERLVDLVEQQDVGPAHDRGTRSRAARACPPSSSTPAARTSRRAPLHSLIAGSAARPRRRESPASTPSSSAFSRPVSRPITPAPTDSSEATRPSTCTRPVGHEHAGERPQQRRLARAAGAEQRDRLARTDREAHAGQPEALGPRRRSAARAAG